MQKWRLVELKSSKDVTNEYRFVQGWQSTIRSIRALWLHLQDIGFSFLNLRNLNQDHVENLFSKIRQHGISNTNPNTHQFVAALKTVIVNSIVKL